MNTLTRARDLKRKMPNWKCLTHLEENNNIGNDTHKHYKYSFDAFNSVIRWFYLFIISVAKVILGADQDNKMKVESRQGSENK